MALLAKLRGIFSGGKPEVAVQSGTPSEQALAKGLPLLQAGEREKARACFEEVLAVEPDNARALHFLGVLAAQDGNFSHATDLISRAVEIGSPDAEMCSNLGNALSELGRIDDAMAAYDRAILIDPNYAYAYLNRAHRFLGLKKLPAALADFEAFLERIPQHAEAWQLRGDTQVALRRYEEGLNSYSTALKLAPSYILFINRGSTLEKLHRFEEAANDFRRAIEIAPDNFLAYFNLGTVLHKNFKIEEAIAAFDKAIRLNPQFALAYHCRASAYDKLRRYHDAIADYSKAIQFGDGYTSSPDMLLYTKLKICDWDDMKELCSLILKGIERGEESARPFLMLALSGQLAVQRKTADIVAKNTRDNAPPFPPLARYDRHDRIRVGYFSADLRNHPVTYLTAELFELHDRERFEIVAFSFGPYDDLTRRVNAAVDDYIDARTLSDEDVVKLARTLEIDIAVDLGGYTDNNRSSLFAMRVAPIQVSYLGFPGTMGEGMHDYLLADSMLIPQELAHWYAEKIVYLPVYQVNDSKRTISERVFSRAELGLPESGFVYCCFNNPIKFNPEIFDVWSRILRRVEDSVIFLLADSADATGNITKEFAARGVAAERIVLGGRLNRPEYLARYRSCDLFLDTLPFNAGTTASDALWAGLPVLTCIGEAFASRMAASLLTSLKLPELVTATLQDYEELAVELAAPGSGLAGLRERLAIGLREELLFDTRLVSRYIETAYSMMYERDRNNLLPEAITIPIQARS